MGAGADGRLGVRPPLGGPLLRLGLPARRAARPVRPTSTTSGSRCRTSWPRPSGPTTPTTPWCAPSATRGRPTTSRASPSASACAVTDSYGSTEGGATVQRTPDTPPGALGRAPEGTVVLDPATGEECPPARFDEHGPAAQRRGGHRRARLQGRRRRLRGVLAQRRGRAGPAARGLVLDGRPGLPRRGRLLLLRRPRPRLARASTARTSRRRRSSGSCSGTPTWCWPPSTPCPTLSSATRSWPRCSCGPAWTRSTPDGARRLPGRPGGPRHEVGAALRAHDRRRSR